MTAQPAAPETERLREALMAASLPLSRALSSNPDVAKTAMDEAVAAFRAAIETGDGS